MHKLSNHDLTVIILVVIYSILLIIDIILILLGKTIGYILMVMTVIITILLYKGIDKTKFKIRNSLYRSFRSSGIYIDIDDHYISFPKVKIDTKESKIVIDISNLRLRSKIETNIEYLSSALPKGLLIKDYYMSKDQSTLILNYEDTNVDNRLIFDTFDEYRDYTLRYKPTELFLDKDYSFDLTKDNGILVTGSSGSGKSYWVQSLILQALIKNYDISILDIKRSYQAFEDVAKCAYTVDDIVSSLDDIIKELEDRQVKMDEVLRLNPQALAIDLGYSIKLIVIEEYMALMNTDASKKILDSIEAKVKRLVVTGRALNINVLSVTQVAAANTLNSSIRANLPLKLVFGNANRTILETTFGIGNMPKISSLMEKGEGMYSEGNDIRHFLAPTLNFNIINAFESLKSEH